MALMSMQAFRTRLDSGTLSVLIRGQRLPATVGGETPLGVWNSCLVLPFLFQWSSLASLLHSGGRARGRRWGSAGSSKFVLGSPLLGPLVIAVCVDWGSPLPGEIGRLPPFSDSP